MILLPPDLPVPLLVLSRQTARAAVLVGNKRTAKVLEWMAMQLWASPELSEGSTDALTSPAPVCRHREKRSAA